MKLIAFVIQITAMAMHVVKGDLDVKVIEKAFMEAEDLLYVRHIRIYFDISMHWPY